MELLKILNWKHYLVLLATLIVFSKGLNNQFNNWDDKVYVTENPFIELNSKNVFQSFFKGETHGMYLPITALSFSVNFKYAQYNPKPYLVVNLIIHLLNVLLVFILLHKLFKNQWLTIFVGALFALHPMQAESVSYVAGRRDILYAIFYFASLVSYLNYIELKHKKWKLYCLLFFVLSLFSKGQAIALPATLVLIDFIKNKSFSLKQSLIDKWLYVLLSVVFIVITLIVKQQSKEYNISGDIVTIPLFYKVSFAAYGFVFYIINLLVPYKLSLVHPYPQMLEITAVLAASLIATVALIYVVFKKYKTDKLLIFGMMFYGLNIFLLLQLIPNSYGIMNDHYVYVSCIGVFISLFFLMQKLKLNTTSIVITFSVLVVGYTAVLTNRVAVFENSVTVFSDVIKKYPDSFVAYNNRGYAWYNLGKLVEAENDFNKSISLNSKMALTYNNRAMIYLASNKFNEALIDLNKAIAINSEFADAYSNRGIAKAMSKDIKAIDDFNKSIELSPNDYKIRFNRAAFFFQTNQIDLACKDLQESKRLGLKKDTRKLDALCAGK